ncbi:HSP20-like chaperones superfamily protein [Actinidia rufa]|uniref:Co-chaperone protein p23 n=1 Tax=Actinidia rufa TaxID=165716 RepID=A0A7J0H8K1_9ERIC|nr:HSP20-like chaperones superfamily protein [Actinidia rufa]
MSRLPEVKWAQGPDKVYVTVLLPDAKNAKVNLEPDGGFTFSASAGADNYLYELKLDLFDKVNVEESKINIGVRSIFCVLEKAEPKWWKKLLRGDDKAPHYVKVDWDKWVDEDDETGPNDLDLGGMDFSKFGDMGGMGGMGDMMGGMGGMMGGMGGGMGDMMGGMGGMGDMMGGMGNDLDDSDEDEEVSKAEEQDAGKAGGEAKAGHETSKMEGATEGKV